MQRRAVAVAGSLAFTMSIAVPALAQQQPAQRGGPPGSNTPYLLVTAFSTSNRKLAVEAADELRKRIQSEHSARDLYVVPKSTIEGALTASGYPTDSALSATDLMELSKQVRGEYAIDGKATKTASGNGVHIEARILLRTGTTTLAQPLPPADGKDVGDAAKIVERSIAEALKGMPNYKDCISDLRAKDYAKAEKDARLGLEAYKNSVLSRVCLLQAQTELKASPDSIIANTKAILAADPGSLLALVNLADAYRAKGDTANVIATNLAMARLDSLSSSNIQPIIDDLYKLGAFKDALHLLDPLLKENPADGPLLKKRWALLMTIASKGTPGAYKRAIVAGEAMAKADTAEATLEYFKRQIGAAQADSDATKVGELATAGGQKFPKEITFQLLTAQAYIKQGKFQPAIDASRRALETDAKNATAGQYVLFALNQLGRTDSLVGAAQKMIAGGVPKDSLAQSLFSTVVGPVLKKAQESKARPDWEAALKAAETVDGVTPSPQTAFYIGYSALQVAGDLLSHVDAASKSTKPAERAQGCADVKQSEDLLAKTSIAMPRGASVDKNAAAQILTNVGSLGDYVTQAKKVLCK